MTPHHKPSLNALIDKEITQTLHDGRFMVAAVTLLILFGLAIGVGWQQVSTTQRERSEAQAEMEGLWHARTSGNPHAAAHQGMHVFKPSGTLAFIDPGLDPVMGTVTKLTAHTPRLPLPHANEDPLTTMPIGSLSPALVMLLLLPLLILALGATAWTSEREAGTLDQLRSVGVSSRRLIVAKAIGLFAAVAMLTLVGSVLGLFAISFFEDTDENMPPPGCACGDASELKDALGTHPGDPNAPDLSPPDSSGRTLWLAGSYATYLLVFAALGLLISIRSKRSHSAVGVALVVWGALVLIAPAFAGPTPAQSDITALQRDLDAALADGNARQKRVTELLSTDLDAANEAARTAQNLRAEATFEAEVYDAHFARLEQTQRTRERALQWLGALSPTFAMRSISAALSGTDGAHHRRFALAAEAHRRRWVERLNVELGASGGDAPWDHEASAEFWAGTPTFLYTPPPGLDAVGQQRVAFGALLGWLLAMVCALALSQRRLERDP